MVILCFTTALYMLTGPMICLLHFKTWVLLDLPIQTNRTMVLFSFVKKVIFSLILLQVHEPSHRKS